jgi:hypothetical protein
MINGKLVIDAVTHAFDARPELADGSPGYRYGMMVHESTFQFQQYAFTETYRLTRAEFFQRMPSAARPRARVRKRRRSRDNRRRGARGARGSAQPND